MINTVLTKVALRYRALLLDIRREDIDMHSVSTAPVMAFTARLKENGFCVSEELLHALNAVSADPKNCSMPSMPSAPTRLPKSPFASTR